MTTNTTIIPAEPGYYIALPIHDTSEGKVVEYETESIVAWIIEQWAVDGDPAWKTIPVGVHFGDYRELDPVIIGPGDVVYHENGVESANERSLSDIVLAALQHVYGRGAA